METGDIIIVLDEKEHEVFGRKGSDLLIKMVRVTLIREHHRCLIFPATVLNRGSRALTVGRVF